MPGWVVKLATDVTLSFGLDHVPELREAAPAELACLVLGPSGDSIELPARDVQISLGGLLLELLGASGWRQAQEDREMRCAA